MAVNVARPRRRHGRGSARQRPLRRSRWRVARRALLLLVLGLACAGLCCCYARVSATFPAGSDAASNALEAWDLLHGNWLLRGWTLTDVSFYTTELPEYAAVEAARGLNPGVLRIAPAVTYTLLVVVSALLAGGRRAGTADRDTGDRDSGSWGAEGWARALIAAAILLAPQLGDGVHVLLAQPDHTGTQVLILGIFLVLERAPRRWYTVGAVWALLTAGIVADKIVIVDAVVPLTFVALLHALWTRRPLAHRFELSLAVAAPAAAAAAGLLLALISRAGGFTMLPVQTGLTTPGSVPGHLSLAWHGVLSLFGSDVTAAAPGPQTALALLHAPGIALAVAAFAATAWRVPNQRDLVGDVLAVGIVVNLGGFVASVIPATPFDTREVAALLPFGAVLAGRVFGRHARWPARRRGGATGEAPTNRPGTTTSRAPGNWPRTATSEAPTNRPGTTTNKAPSNPPGTATSEAPGKRPGTTTSEAPGDRLRWPGRTLAWAPSAAFVLAGACQLAALGYGAAQPAAADPERALAAWLAAHQLTSGLGTFNEDNLATLDSDGRVRLLTVSWQPPAPPAGRSWLPDRRTGQAAQAPPGGGAVARLYQSSASWYDPGDHYADFVVTGTAEGTADLIPRREIIALAGPPARTYQFQSFTVMVWDTNLLAQLGGPPSRLPGVIGRP